jgi:DNA polymerase III psi subunit
MPCRKATTDFLLQVIETTQWNIFAPEVLAKISRTVQVIDGPSSAPRIAVSEDERISNWPRVKLHVSVADSDAHKDRVICSLTPRGITFSAEA